VFAGYQKKRKTRRNTKTSRQTIKITDSNFYIAIWNPIRQRRNTITKETISFVFILGFQMISLEKID